MTKGVGEVRSTSAQAGTHYYKKKQEERSWLWHYNTLEYWWVDWSSVGAPIEPSGQII